MKKMVVKGMTCGHCKMRVEKALMALEFVKEVSVDLEKGIVILEETDSFERQKVIDAVENAGYDVVTLD
jgi:copper chaperone CopZ